MHGPAEMKPGHIQAAVLALAVGNDVLDGDPMAVVAKVDGAYGIARDGHVLNLEARDGRRGVVARNSVLEKPRHIARGDVGNRQIMNVRSGAKHAVPYVFDREITKIKNVG